jgi:hypothetical protein
MNSHGAQNTSTLEDIRRVLQQAEKPLTSAALGKLLGKKRATAFKPVLDAEVRAGRIYSWGSMYWDRDPKGLALAFRPSSSMAKSCSPAR